MKDRHTIHTAWGLREQVRAGAAVVGFWTLLLGLPTYAWMAASAIGGLPSAWLVVAALLSFGLWIWIFACYREHLRAHVAAHPWNMTIWSAVAWSVSPTLATFAAWQIYGWPSGRVDVGSLLVAGAVVGVIGFTGNGVIAWRAHRRLGRRQPP